MPGPTLAGAIRRATTDPDRPLRQGPFQSDLRDERLAAWLGAALGACFSICFLTGLLSHLHQHPVSWFDMPARPVGLYRFTQGLHVATGIASVPVLLGKLWVVWPRLLSFPPFRRPSDVVERLGVVALVGGGLFMVFSGVANIAQWYPWRFSFTATHHWMAWVTIGALVAHVGAKWATTRQAVRRRGRRPALAEADPAIGAVAESATEGLTRRQLLATVAGTSSLLTLTTVGQAAPGLARFAVLAPRDARDRPVNRSAANAGVIDAATSDAFRLVVEGDVANPLALTVPELLQRSQHEATLPIACVEGWSFSARWRGVQLRDLLGEAGARPGRSVRVESLEQGSIYASSVLGRRQASDRDTLLATHLDGAPLTLDHGAPVRLIAGNRPGVLQTKWVTRVVVL
jgi:DMSO/TMAO reductase YedYZ molybdopterin-dependent catalytic subunit